VARDPRHPPLVGWFGGRSRRGRGRGLDRHAEQKVWGLMQVWGAVKRDFVFFDTCPAGLGRGHRDADPRVLAAESRDEYYRRLNRGDLPSSGTATRSRCRPRGATAQRTAQRRVPVVEERVILARVAIRTNPRSAREAGVGAVRSRATWPASILQETPWATTRQHEAGRRRSACSFLVGPEGQPVKLTLKDAAGGTRTVTMVPQLLEPRGSTFQAPDPATSRRWLNHARWPVGSPICGFPRSATKGSRAFDSGSTA